MVHDFSFMQFFRNRFEIRSYEPERSWPLLVMQCMHGKLLRTYTANVENFARINCLCESFYVPSSLFTVSE